MRLLQLRNQFFERQLAVIDAAIDLFQIRDVAGFIAAPLKTNEVEAGQARAISPGQRERRNIQRNHSAGANHRHFPHPHKLMEADHAA